MLECNICYDENLTVRRRCLCQSCVMCDACLARVFPNCPFCRADLHKHTPGVTFQALVAVLVWAAIVYFTWLVAKLFRFCEWVLILFTVDVVISYRRPGRSWNTVVVNIAPLTDNVINAFDEID